MLSDEGRISIPVGRGERRGGAAFAFGCLVELLEVKRDEGSRGVPDD
jgi:hypothetical protein